MQIEYLYVRSVCVCIQRTLYYGNIRYWNYIECYLKVDMHNNVNL